VSVSRDNHLAANLVPNSLLAAKFDHGRGSGHAKSGFEGTGFVVNAGMNHAAIVAALVASHPIFFLKKQEPDARKAPRDLQRNSEPNHSSADDDYIVT